MDKMTIDTTQTTTEKTKDWAPRSGELRGAMDGKTVPSPLVVTHSITHAKYLVISYEWGHKTGYWLRQTELIHGHVWYRHSVTVDLVPVEVTTSTLPLGTLLYVASLLATIQYQYSTDRKHKLWTIA